MNWKKKKEPGPKRFPRKEGVHFITDELAYSEDVDDFIFRVVDTKIQGDIMLNVESVNVPFIIDSGASVRR